MTAEEDMSLEPVNVAVEVSKLDRINNKDTGLVPPIAATRDLV